MLLNVMVAVSTQRLFALLFSPGIFLLFLPELLPFNRPPF
jgi:hypothetical protein